MTTKNPCRECDIFKRGKGYDDAHCLHCRDREDYVQALGPMCASMPVAMMDIAQPRRQPSPAVQHPSPALLGPPKVGKEIQMQTPKTKVCQRKDCEHGGSPQPLDNFHNHRRYSDGKQRMCKDCVRKYQQDLRNRKKEAKIKKPASKTPPPAKPKATTDPPAPVEPKSVSTATSRNWMDQLFNGHSDLLEKLHKLAESELRTPRKQLLYMIQTASNGHKPGHGFLGLNG